VYAIIQTGGKQFKVSEGDEINVELLKVNEGDSFNINEVLLVSNGDSLNIGAPFVNGASVETTVVGHGKEKKVIIYKYKRKSGYHKKKGHRQPFTTLKIEKIIG
jgi:large subunit ribosomal protein L21